MPAKTRKRRVVHREGHQATIKRKPSSDEAGVYTTFDRDRARAVRFPHDRLIKSYAITHREFLENTGS